MIQTLYNWWYTSRETAQLVQWIEVLEPRISRAPSALVMLYVDENRIDAEINEVLHAAEWKVPLASTVSARFLDTCIRNISSLTLPNPTVVPPRRIRAVVQRIASLRSLYLPGTSDESTASLCCALSKQHPIKSVNWNSPSIALLHQISSLRLETLIISHLNRPSSFPLSFAQVISRFTSAQTLHLNQASLTTNELNAICTACHSIRYLAIPNNGYSLTGNWVQALPRLRLLNVLNLNYIPMDVLEVRSLASLAKSPLTTLSMRQCCHITDHGRGDAFYVTLLAISSLRVLDLVGSELTTRFFAQLTRLPLQTLECGGFTRVTETGSGTDFYVTEDQVDPPQEQLQILQEATRKKPDRTINLFQGIHRTIKRSVEGNLA